MYASLIGINPRRLKVPKSSHATDLVYVKSSSSHTFTDKKSRTFQFPVPSWIIFQDLCRSPRMFEYKEKNGIYLQYSECSPVQKIHCI